MEELQSSNNGEKFKKIKNDNNNGENTHFIEKAEDRLSSLPNCILIHILSFLDIDSAIKTSVLSHQWRNLWTETTRLDFDSDNPNTEFAAILDHILHQLTSPNLHSCRLITNNSIRGEKLGSIFHRICSRNVAELAVRMRHQEFFVPACVLQCQSLVVLDLKAELGVEFPEYEFINLPNLKMLRLLLWDDAVKSMKSLISSCPILEDLDLEFILCHDEHCVDICAPNLKYLSILMRYGTEFCKIEINAPKLESLSVWDSSSLYSFVKDPTMLAEARFGLRPGKEDQSYEEDLSASQDYVCQLSKFIRGMSSLRYLSLQLGCANIFSCLNCVDHGILPTFGNLTCFSASLDHLSTWNDLLLCLQFFPNLESLEVSMEDDNNSGVKQFWSAPELVPCCFLCKLKRIIIKELEDNDDEAELMKFILSNALVLEELFILSEIGEGQKGSQECSSGSEECQIWKEAKICDALFKLPRSSSTCNVVFKGKYKCIREELKNWSTFL